MVAGLRCSLAEIGVDVVKEVADERLVLSSDSATTATGGFDMEAMLQLLNQAVDQSLEDGFKGLWASGDMAWEFGAEKNFSKLLEYEIRLETIFQRSDTLYGICQYHRDSLPADALRDGVLSHHSVFINETLSRTNPYYFPTGALEGRKNTKDELDKAVDDFLAP
jgi:hypothetical protein